jgi:hypothetical protein
MRPMIRLLALAGSIAIAASDAAIADQAVSVGGALALLNKPGSARAAVILIPGGDGVLNVQQDGTFTNLGGNQLVRTRKAYLAQGIATLTIDRGVDVAAAVNYMRGISRSVVVVATSRGSLRVAAALAARPNGIVLTAAFLDNVRSSVGSPAALPPTLIVHHRQDGCRHTPPGAVEPFKAWGGARVRVAWMDGGVNVGDPCQARAYHGFNGLDGKVVATVAQFAASLR